MTDSANILFRLLRAALGDETEVSLPDDVDWNEVVDLAFDQGVAAMLVDGLDKATKTMVRQAHQPTKTKTEELDFLESEELEDLRYELFGEALSCEEDYAKHLEAIRYLADIWASEGLYAFALKGIAFARYYPVPAHRYSCDFDCNVRSREGNFPAWEKADQVVKGNGIEVDSSMSKHSRYVVNGISVENHRSIIGVNGSRKRKRFDAYLQGLLQPSEENLLKDAGVYAPCWLFDALFYVEHARVHFIDEEGISIKHVLDWMQIRKAPEADKYREQLEKDIDRFGLRKFFDALDGVADYVMGVRGELSEAQKRMLEDILAKKNVRHFDSRLLVYLNILRTLWKNRWKYKLYSETTFLATVWRYVYGHLFDRKI